MKLSVWVTVSDVVPARQTLFEKTLDVFDKKHSIFRSFPHTYVFQSLKQAGVNGIELLIPLYASDKNIQNLKEILDKNAVPVFSIHQSLSKLHDITLAEIEKLCQIAKMFYATVIVLHAKTLGEKLFDSDFIDTLKKYQEKYNIAFGIENMEKSRFSTQPYTYNGKDLSSVIKKAGLNMTFDTTHLAQAGEEIIPFYLTNQERIVNIHLSDYKKTWLNIYVLPQIYTHLALGEGELPIEKFLKTLKHEKYKGIITMEINASLTKLCESAIIIKKYTQ